MFIKSLQYSAFFKKQEQCGYSPIAGRNPSQQTASTLALSQICPLDSVGMALPIDPHDQRVQYA